MRSVLPSMMTDQRSRATQEVKGCILLVEDSPTQAAELVFILEEAGFAVEVAPDAPRGLERLSSARFDLVLADVLMPGMSGFEMCRAIKEDPQTAGVPVVFLTTLNDIVDIVRGLASGADGYLNKPCEPEVLIAAVEGAIARKRRRDRGEPAEWHDIHFAGERFTLRGDSRQVSDYLLSVLHHFGRELERLARETAARYGHAAAEALRRSEERFALALAGTNDGLWDWELQSNRIFFSDRWAEIARCKPESLGPTVEAWLSRIHPEDRQRLEQEIQAHVEGKLDQLACEHRLRGDDGAYRWVLARGGAARDAQGRAFRLAGSLTDIHDRKMLERNLLEAQAMYRDLVEDLNEIVYVVDADGIVTYVSKAVTEISGYTPEELLGRSFKEIVLPEDLPIAIDTFQRRLRGERILGEYRLLTKSGEVRHVRTNSRAIVQDGRIVGLRGVLTDITKYKEIEAALKRRSEIENFIIATSTDLLDCADHEIERGIASALENIAGFAEADRCVVCVALPQRQAYQVVGEWRAPGAGTSIPLLLQIRDFPRLAERYRALHAVSVTRLDDLDPEDGGLREILARAGVRSLAAVPLHRGRPEAVGVLALGHSSERTWSDEIIGLLWLVAPALRTVLERAKRGEVQ